MKKYRVGFCSLVFLILLMGTILPSSNGFTVDPLFTDTIGDDTPGQPFTDIIDVWADNTATHLRFKIRLSAPFNQSISGAWYIETMISVDNDTGSSYGGMMVDYALFLWTNDGAIGMNFWDFNNGANDLFDAHNFSMCYWSFTDNNHTWEWGYKLQTYTPASKGLLNASCGQQIYFKIRAGPDTDYAPNQTAEPIGYVLKSCGTGIPSFNLIFLSSTLIAIGTLYFLKKKTIKL